MSHFSKGQGLRHGFDIKIIALRCIKYIKGHILLYSVCDISKVISMYKVRRAK